VSKRVFWLVTGVAFGVTMALSVERAVRRQAQRLRPERLAGDLAGGLRDLGRDLQAAVAEGRDGMREREAELRAKLDERVAAHP
jgi:hypothetical protein